MTKPARTHRLSKSRFVAGWQCHKLLWWKVHDRDAVELQPDIVLQDRFDQLITCNPKDFEVFDELDVFDPRGHG